MQDDSKCAPETKHLSYCSLIAESQLFPDIRSMILIMTEKQKEAGRFLTIQPRQKWKTFSCLSYCFKPHFIALKYKKLERCCLAGSLTTIGALKTLRRQKRLMIGSILPVAGTTEEEFPKGKCNRIGASGMHTNLVKSSSLGETYLRQSHPNNWEN